MHYIRTIIVCIQRTASEHAIDNIHRVVQDDRDLNCFAFVTHDDGLVLCHVFCTLTAVSSGLIKGAELDVHFCDIFTGFSDRGDTDIGTGV